MKEIKLGRSGKVTFVDDDVYEHVRRVPWFIRKKADGRLSRVIANRQCHTTKNGRSVILKCRPGPTYRALHHLILKGCGQVDHKDGNPLNNLRSNLRCADASKNLANNNIRKDNTSGFRGVSKNGDQWAAQGRKPGSNKKTTLGRADTPEEAARIRDKYARLTQGEFGRYNFPLSGERGLDGIIAP